MSKLSLKRIVRAVTKRLPLRIEVHGFRSNRNSETDRFDYQQKFNNFEILPDWVVLDIGSGHYPFPYATVLTDHYLGISHHRTEELVRDERPFLVSDICHLPFADKSVDFIYCSHVLEHMDDPAKACQELMRVGKRGYIETPTLAKDMLFAWARGMHKWHVMAVGDTLIFCEYAERQLDGVRSPYWRETVLGRHRHPLQVLFDENQDVFNVMFNWEDHFECAVFPLKRLNEADGDNGLSLTRPLTQPDGCER